MALQRRGGGWGGKPRKSQRLDLEQIIKTAWKLNISFSDLDKMSIREFQACSEAHGEYHGTEQKTELMTKERLDALELGKVVKITDFKGPKNGDRH